MNDQELLQAGYLRLVCRRRARVLEKRGEEVRWSNQLYGWVWKPVQGAM